MFNKADCDLREIAQTDLEKLLSWRNAERIRQVMYTDHLITREEHQRWYEIVAAKPENRRHWLFVYQGTLLGQVNVVDINRQHLHCHWGFYVGEPNAPQGSGMVMGILALDRIFFEMGINRVCGEALASNEASIRYHKRLGFRQEGCLRQHIKKAETYEDVICFGLLKQEWELEREALLAKWMEDITNGETGN